MHTDEPDAGAPQLSDPLSVMDEETAEKLRDYNHLVELAVTYHDEATRCARAGCFLAGAVMVGAMLEAVLVVMTMAFETDLSFAFNVALPSGGSSSPSGVAWRWSS